MRDDQYLGGKDLSGGLATTSLMTYTHAIFIDESGAGCHAVEINAFWVSMAFAVPFDRMSDLEKGVKRILATYYRRGNTEIKGSGLPKQLVPGTTIDALMGEMATLWDSVGATAWGVGSRAGTNMPPGFNSSKPLVKDIVRYLLMERINGYLDANHGGSGSYLIVWDISDLRELIDFSKSTSVFKNGINGNPISERLAPAILGGLSHDWSGIQFADLIAHCALHHCACDHGEGRMQFNQEKKDAFVKWIYPRLQKDRGGRTVGWKYW